MTSNRLFPEGFLERPAAKAKQVAGRLCLDFTNAVGGWTLHQFALGTPEFAVRDDRFRAYEDLVAWAHRAGALERAQTLRLLREAKDHPQAALAIWRRGLRLRSAIHAVAWSFENRRSPKPADLDILAREAALAREGQRLEARSSNLEWRLPEDFLPLDAPLALAALSAEDYFIRGDLSRLHSCPGEDCGWLFEDTTRNRSRRWCDMGDCGNSAKVQKFRARAKRIGTSPDGARRRA